MHPVPLTPPSCLVSDVNLADINGCDRLWPNRLWPTSIDRLWPKLWWPTLAKLILAKISVFVFGPRKTTKHKQTEQKHKKKTVKTRSRKQDNKGWVKQCSPFLVKTEGRRRFHKNTASACFGFRGFKFQGFQRVLDGF